MGRRRRWWAALALAPIGWSCASPNARLARANWDGNVAEARRILRTEQVDIDAKVAFNVGFMMDLMGSPLSTAVGSLNPELVELVLAAGAKPDRLGFWGAGERTPLSMLMMNETLFKREEGVSAPEGTSSKAFYDRGAKQARIFALARMLLAHAADPGWADEYGNTPLHLMFMGAARCSDVSGEIYERMVFDLTDKGARADVLNGAKQSPLSLAVRCGLGEPIAWLRRAGADLNAVAADGTTALTEAIHLRHAGVVKALLKAGADPSVSSPKLGSVCAVMGKGSPDRGRDWVLEVLNADGLPCAVAFAEKRQARINEAFAAEGRYHRAHAAPLSWPEQLAREQSDARFEAKQRAEAAAKAEAVAETRRASDVQTATCRAGTTSCGRYCCGSGTMCCASEDRADTSGGMCLPSGTGKSCPWGMRQAR